MTIEATTFVYVSGDSMPFTHVPFHSCGAFQHFFCERKQKNHTDPIEVVIAQIALVELKTRNGGNYFFISASISSTSMGIPASSIISMGPFSVISIWFSMRTPMPSSAMYMPGSQLKAIPTCMGS